jgi:hypothetical protein
MIDIGEVARRQRAMMFCMLAYVVVIVAQLVVKVGANLRTNYASTGGTNADISPVAMVVAIASVVVVIISTVFVFRLALVIYTNGTGILMGFGTLVPWIGLLALFTVNKKATEILKQNWIPVGFMGADPSRMPPRGTMVPEFRERMASLIHPPGYYPPPGQYPPPQGYPPAR